MDREEEKDKARKRRANKFRVREKMCRYARDILQYNERDFTHWKLFILGPEWRDKERPTREQTIKELVDREVQMSETHPRCSCNMCGNQRRHFGTRTIQEYRWALNAKEQVKELDLGRGGTRLHRFLTKREAKLRW
jgi:hypothetical protein